MFSESRNPTVIMKKFNLYCMTLKIKVSTLFCMTLLNSGRKNDTNLILVSILTFFRSRISKLLQKSMWTWQFTLKRRRSHTFIVWSFVAPVVYMLQTRNLGVDSNIYNVENLIKPKISLLTMMVYLENEGQTHFCMTFRISHGCKHHTDMIFVLILTYSRPGISKMLK